MRLWIKLQPEEDFPAKLKLKQGITLCHFNLLESYFRFFDLEIGVESLIEYQKWIFQ